MYNTNGNDVRDCRELLLLLEIAEN